MNNNEISLRDYFAAHCPSYPEYIFIDNEDEREKAAAEMAKWNYIYADAMLAERAREETKASETKNQPAPVEADEPQIDWSQAPEWANWWAMDCNGNGFFYGIKPHIDLVDDSQWIGDSQWINVNESNTYGSLGQVKYTGPWRTSLRQRPK